MFTRNVTITHVGGSKNSFSLTGMIASIAGGTLTATYSFPITPNWKDAQMDLVGNCYTHGLAAQLYENLKDINRLHDVKWERVINEHGGMNKLTTTWRILNNGTDKLITLTDDAADDVHTAVPSLTDKARNALAKLVKADPLHVLMGHQVEWLRSLNINDAFIMAKINNSHKI